MIQRYCCFNLKTAGLIIGWIGAIVSLINVGLNIVSLARLNDMMDRVADPRTNELPDNAVTTKKFILVIIAIQITFSAINCVCSVFLVIGTIKERHLMLVPWIINSGIAIGYSFIAFIGCIIFGIIYSFPIGTILLLMIIVGTMLGFSIYTWLAVYSLYKMLRGE